MVKQMCVRMICIILLLASFPALTYANDVKTVKVSFPIGKPYYMVGDTRYQMDAEAYISTVSKSTMVPVRYLMDALNTAWNNGGSITSEWDGGTNSITIHLNAFTTVQFTGGDSHMIVNGVSVQMANADGQPAVAEISGGAGHERMYIPLRALGAAAGVPIDWDAKTRTAMFSLYQ